MISSMISLVCVQVQVMMLISLTLRTWNPDCHHGQGQQSIPSAPAQYYSVVLDVPNVCTKSALPA